MVWMGLLIIFNKRDWKIFEIFLGGNKFVFVGVFNISVKGKI